MNEIGCGEKQIQIKLKNIIQEQSVSVGDYRWKKTNNVHCFSVFILLNGS